MSYEIMPELGYEIEEFNYNTWHIKNWQHLDKSITGPEFEVGGWKWRILLFPFGNNNQDTVSIYLDFVDPKGAPAGWHSCVQFALVLCNSEDPTQFIWHQTHHRFTAEESDWGFTRFYELNKLFYPCENRTRAIIENYSANITAIVRVFKDPTGVLWHNFINYDSKKVTGYVGLKNQGATGYLNSLLQSLYCITSFRKAVYQIPTEDDELIESVPLALQRVFHNLQTSNITVCTTELTKSFGWNSFDTLIYRDVQEFNRVLQDNLETKMKGTKADGALTKLFAGKMKSYIKCINVDYESSRVENYYDIQLNVKGCKTLRDSFKDYIQEEILEGDNKYQTVGYGLQVAKKRIVFESFPPVLHLQLKRFKYDIQKGAIVKINDRFEYPMEIDLEEFLSKDADKSNSHKYLLHGVLVHSGDLHKGHYFALLKPEKDGKWFKFDDDRVIPVTENEVLEYNYGGKNPNNNPNKIGHTLIKHTNAYVLIYIRESNINEVLSPLVSEDVPSHLCKRRLKELISLLEIKKNLTVKVVTTEKFRNHQGFDLANFDDRQYPLSDVQTYSILKSETYGDFKENISLDFNIPSEQIRLWILVNRQNKTIRPDSPIPESCFDIGMEVIHKKFTSRQNEMMLYMEVAEKPIDDKTWFPEENDHKMIFLKYFDPNKQAFAGLGHLYVHDSEKVSDYTHVFCEKMGLPPDTPLKIYEEIKSTMIEKMNLESTFQQLEIQNGDIICLQKDLSEEEYIYTFLYSIILLKHYIYIYIFFFRIREYISSGRFATHLCTDPLRLRFTSAFSTSDTPKSIIKRTTALILSEMLQTANLRPSTHILFYEVLDVELETKKFFKVAWLGSTIREEEIIDIYLQKNAIISDLKEEILKKVSLSSPNSRIRLFEVHHNKINKDYSGTEPIESIQEFATLYAEEIPMDEIVANQYDRIIQICHFKEDPISLHGIPFKFIIKNGEKLIDTKVRLRQRLGMSENDFSKVKISIMPGTLYARPEYLYDENIIISEIKLSSKDYLGLDYVDSIGQVERIRGSEAIYIRN
ncbi:cysteine proteinase [Rhizophagus irregularis]|uniref:ubiquitinyl hydrolase 1 n=1 Tax=Rhizophagus irregularis TaxID=588596 RepID=A0A2I1HJ11_9GLOM|nr:cysteine proteinase [Rhizophagus irregularis]